jgi:hypothetical protein
MAGRASSTPASWVKLVVALLCTAAAGTFIYLRVRGPAPAQLDPAVEAEGGLMGRRSARRIDEARPPAQHTDEDSGHEPAPGALP